MSEQYGEPWHLEVDSYGVKRIWAEIDGDLIDVACCCGDGMLTAEEEKANALRIVACVNACRGIATAVLEDETKFRELRKIPVGSVNYCRVLLEAEGYRVSKATDPLILADETVRQRAQEILDSIRAKK